jgi:hypothetical protein
MCGFGVKVTIFPQIPQLMGLERNLFSKMCAGNFIYLTAVSKSAYLFPVSCENRYSAYIVIRHYISCGEGEYCLNRCHFNPEATSPRRVGISKNRAGHISTHWTVSSLLFSRQKYCCTQSTYLTSLLWTEAKIQGSCNERSLFVSYVLMLTSIMNIS